MTAALDGVREGGRQQRLPYWTSAHSRVGARGRRIAGTLRVEPYEGMQRMLRDFGDIAVKLSRNPLGVLSLAFVLVYGIAGLVCASSALQAGERLVLVWFVALFPMVAFAAFYRLVTKHASKLFGPSDFSDEASFLAYTSGQRTSEQAMRTSRAAGGRTQNGVQDP